MSFLPAHDTTYLKDKNLLYEEVEENGQKAIIFHSYRLPTARFDAVEAKVLILLPSGYPDVAPDMFHLLPWVHLANGNQYPAKADSPVVFRNETWQRWSRHNPEWRPGIDGIWTMLKRIDTALAVAA